MPKRTSWSVLFILTASLIGFSGPSLRPRPEEMRPIRAPLHPDLFRILQKQGILPPGTAIPGTHDAARPAAAGLAEGAALPSYYDLRALNKMTAVRDEAGLGGSTVFAALASLESYLKPAEAWDFSEQHLKAGLFGSQSLDTIVGALSRWSDPVREADFPWPASPRADEAVKHVQDVIYIQPRASALDNDRIKQAVLDHGAIWSDMVFSTLRYNSSQAAYYNAGSEGETRALAIAGWDDAFDRTKFSPAAPGNGAFLCKDSRGAAWGNGGYIYVSYHDVFLARRYYSAAIKAEPRSGYTVQYARDHNGCTARIGFRSETAWFSAPFISISADPLAAVAFYAFTASGEYEILVYRDAIPGQPRSGSLALRQTGAYSAPGYMTIPLTTSVPLLLNQRFSVVVRLRTDGDEFPIPLEHPIEGIAAEFAAAPGEGYISPDGTTWTDLTTSDGGTYARASLCLKAFAGYPALYPPAGLKAERLTNNFYFFKEYVDKLSWMANPKNAAPPAKYRIYRKDASAGDETFTILGEVPGTLLLYFVRAVQKDDAFVYRVTAVLTDGRESDPAEFAI